ncbi:hypothetical protein TWF718_009821 [Orbilia javanica]|uniref:F-box domain-containing protein n=1 Tax=Orbilia javanica TaxID=47235 RepID=A0AAN8N053_9PEZI
MVEHIEFCNHTNTKTMKSRTRTRDIDAVSEQLLETNITPQVSHAEDTTVADAVTTMPLIPTELEIEIISFVPFKYWAKLGRVCRRWRAITRLPQLLYLPITTQPPLPRDIKEYKAVNFLIHRAAYEVGEYLGDTINIFTFRKPDPCVRRCISPYSADFLTIPPFPHTLQDVQFNIMMPPREDRTVRPGHAFKVIPVPCKNYRKLLVTPHPTNSRLTEVTNLQRKREPTGLTVGEFYDSIRERARVRLGDTYDKMLITWRVRNLQTEWWWKDWDIGPGLYKLDLVIQNEPAPQEQVSYASR